MAEGVVIKIDGDATGLRQTAAETQRMMDQALSGVSKNAATASAALDGVAKNAGAQSAALEGVLSAVGTGSDSSMMKLMDLAAKAELADEKLAVLRGRADEMRSALESAQATAQQSADALKLLQDSADASAENIAYLNEAMQSGNMSAQEYMAAKDQVSEFETELKALNAEIAKQQQINTKATTSVQQLSKQYADLTLKVSGAEVAATSANTKLESMAQSLIDGAEASGDALGSFDTISKQSGKSTVALGDMLDDLASGAFNEVSQSALTAVRGMDSFGGSTVIVSAAARGLQSVIRGMIGGGAGWIALAGAIAYAVYQIYQFTSGAHAAREALEGLNKTAEEWKSTEAKTIYSGTGLDRFGIDKAQFDTTLGDTKTWLDNLNRTWSDGKKESNKIVKEYTDGFKQGSDKIREAMDKRRFTQLKFGVVDDETIEKDKKRLQELDTEVEKLLKKKQNKKLTEKEQTRLDQITQERLKIQLRYTTGDGGGYDSIRAAVDAEKARLAAEGKEPGADLYGDALKAGAQGHKEAVDALNASYHEQYAAIQAITNEDEHRVALEALDLQHKKDLAAAQEEYNALVTKYAKEAYESEGVQEGKHKVEGVKAMIDVLNSDDSSAADKADALAKLNEEISAADKGNMASYMALIEQIKSLAENGAKPEDLAELFPEINIGDVLGGYSTIGEFLNDHKGEFPSLESMFQETLPKEIAKIAAELDLDTTAWDNFAANPGAIKATEVDATNASVSPPTQTVAAFISLYKEAVNAGVTPPSKEVDAWIKAYLEGENVSLEDLKPALAAIVDAYDNLTTEEQVDALKPIMNAIVADFQNNTTPEQKKALQPLLDALVQAFKETEDGTGSKEALLAALTGFITEWDSTGAEPPKVPTPEPIKVQFYYEQMQKPAANIFGLALGDGDAKTLERLIGYMKEIESGDTTNFQNLQEALEMMNFNGSAENVANFLNATFDALERGDSLSEDTIEQLQDIQEFLATLGRLNTAGYGLAVPEAIDKGMKDHNFGPSAENMAKAVETAVNAALQINSPSKRMIPAGQGVAEGVAEGMQESTAPATAAEALASAISSALNPAAADAKTAGANVGQGFANGMASKLATVIKEAARLAKVAINTINTTSENASPSKASRRSGRFVGDGFALGINDRVKDAQAASRALGRAGLGGLNVSGLHMAAISTSNGATASPLPFTLDQLADAMAQRPALFDLDGQRFARATVEPNAAAEARRQARIRAGYGG